MNIDYCVLQFNALNFVLGVRLHGGSMPNFNFFQCKAPKFDNEIVKLTTQIA